MSLLSIQNNRVSWFIIFFLQLFKNSFILSRVYREAIIYSIFYILVSSISSRALARRRQIEVKRPSETVVFNKHKGEINVRSNHLPRHNRGRFYRDDWLRYLTRRRRRLIHRRRSRRAKCRRRRNQLIPRAKTFSIDGVNCPCLLVSIVVDLRAAARPTSHVCPCVCTRVCMCVCVNGSVSRVAGCAD